LSLGGRTEPARDFGGGRSAAAPRERRRFPAARPPEIYENPTGTPARRSRAGAVPQEAFMAVLKLDED